MKYYTFAELQKMGIKEDDLKYRFYRNGNYKRFGITLKEKIVVEKIVSQESFDKYFKKLIKKK
jgi:hypothetical protein